MKTVFTSNEAEGRHSPDRIIYETMAVRHGDVGNAVNSMGSVHISGSSLEALTVPKPEYQTAPNSAAETQAAVNTIISADQNPLLNNPQTISSNPEVGPQPVYTTTSAASEAETEQSRAVAEAERIVRESYDGPSFKAYDEESAGYRKVF